MESTFNIKLGVCQSPCLFPTTDLLILNVFTTNNTTNKVLLACRKIFIKVKKTLQSSPALGRKPRTALGQQSASWLRVFLLCLVRNHKKQEAFQASLARGGDRNLSIWLLRAEAVGQRKEQQVAPSSVTVMCTPQVSRLILGASSTLILSPGSQILVPEP